MATATRPVLGELNVGNVPAPKGGKTIEQIYQKKSQLEHILLRPDSYSE
jgi:DNA topoisomerase-2